jgi:hypothetical protein
MEDTDPRFPLAHTLTPPPAFVPPTPEPLFETTLPGIGGQRQEERIPFRAKVQAIPLDGRRGEILGTTEDICHRGLFVKSRGRLAVDSLVVIKLHTAHGKLKLSARVVHNLEGIGFGCKFIDLDPGQRAALSLLVSAHASAPRKVRTIH